MMNALFMVLAVSLVPTIMSVILAKIGIAFARWLYDRSV